MNCFRFVVEISKITIITIFLTINFLCGFFVFKELEQFGERDTSVLIKAIICNNKIEILNKQFKIVSKIKSFLLFCFCLKIKEKWNLFFFVLNLSFF